MHRRQLLILGFAVLTALPVLAETTTDSVIDALRREGYAQIEVSRTWLGRTRVVAENGREAREIVINSHSGEILRDVVRVIARAVVHPGGDGTGQNGDQNEADHADDDGEHGGHGDDD